MWFWYVVYYVGCANKISVDLMGMLVGREYVTGGLFNLIWAVRRYNISVVEVGYIT